MGEIGKSPLGVNVLDAARSRISKVFDEFEKVYVSFSGGKDSTVMTHLVAEEAQKRERRIGLLFVDLEGQYKLTIDHTLDVYQEYSDFVDPYWVALPLHLRNGVSQFEHHWVCWDPDRREDWIRNPPEIAITDPSVFPFFRSAMEFEEFVPEFGRWYSEGKSTACLVGIRCDESLNRWRTIKAQRKRCFDGLRWTTYVGGSVFNAYPIYDWRTEDIWTYHGVTGRPYNKLYDLMHKAGLTIHQSRICQPYGDDQRKGLWLFQIIEPETWGKVVARVNGANQGALYARESGNILGVGKIGCPPGHTWKSFARMLLDSMPDDLREHYENKIMIFIKWWRDNRDTDIIDEGERKMESERKVPSWRRICKALLRNDYWCKGLSFSQTNSDSYDKYIQMMRKRKQRWNISL